MASPSHVEATKGFFRHLGINQTLPEAAEDKDYYSGLIRDQLNLDDASQQPGRVSVTFTVKSAFTNPYNTLHGGVVAAVAEIVGMACAKTVVKDKEFFLGEFSTSYLAAARLNQEVEVVGKILRQGRSVAVIAVDFKVKETGKLYYASRLTFYMIPVAKL